MSESIEPVKPVKKLSGFLEFIRTQGVVGLAVGFILGGAVSGLVNSIVTDLINPIISIALGRFGDLTKLTLGVFDAKIMYGHFISIVINFIVISAVVYFGVKGLGLDKLDKPKA